MLSYINWDEVFKIPDKNIIHNAIMEYNTCVGKLKYIQPDLEYIDNSCCNINQHTIFNSHSITAYYQELENQLLFNYWKHIISQNILVNKYIYTTDFYYKSNINIISSTKFIENNIIKIFNDVKEEFINNFYKIVNINISKLTYNFNYKTIVHNALTRDFMNYETKCNLVNLEIFLNILTNKSITADTLNITDHINILLNDNNPASFSYYKLKKFNNGNVHLMFHKKYHDIVDIVKNILLAAEQENQFKTI